MKLFSIIVAVVITVSVAPHSWAASLILNYLEDYKDINMQSCGCTVTDTNKQSLENGGIPILIFSDLDSTEDVYDEKGFIGYKAIHPPAFISLLGKRHELKCISSTKKSGASKRGQRFTKVYAEGAIRLVLHYRTTFTCPPRDDDCEVTGYTVDAILTIDGQTHKLIGLKGSCGC